MDHPFGDRPAHRWLVLGLLGAGLVVRPWLDAARDGTVPRGMGATLVVTSSADAGQGTLREAIFEAYGIRGTVEVVLQVGRIDLSGPLPPVAASRGITFRATGQGTVLEGPPGSAEPALVFASRGASLEGVTIEHSGTCLQSNHRVTLKRIALVGCAVGVLLGEGADGTSITESRFERNGIGIRIDPGASDVGVKGNHFLESREAAIYVVGEDPARLTRPILIQGNAFKDDRIAIMLINGNAAVSENEIEGTTEAGLYLAGLGAVVYSNRLEGGQGVGVLAVGARGARLQANQISGFATAGISWRGGRGSYLHGNRIYRNGYGMLVRFTEPENPLILEENAAIDNAIDGIVLIGASPVLRRNITSGNGSTGIRLLNIASSDGTAGQSLPLLQSNVSGDGPMDVVVRDSIASP